MSDPWDIGESSQYPKKHRMPLHTKGRQSFIKKQQEYNLRNILDLPQPSQSKFVTSGSDTEAYSQSTQGYEASLSAGTHVSQTPRQKYDYPTSQTPTLPSSGSRGWTWPGHNYTGPGNPIHNGMPQNQTDLASYHHDLAYNRYLGSGQNPYTHSNSADSKWISEAGSDIPGVLGKAFFTAKGYIAPALDEGMSFSPS